MADELRPAGAVPAPDFDQAHGAEPGTRGPRVPDKPLTGANSPEGPVCGATCPRVEPWTAAAVEHPWWREHPHWYVIEPLGEALAA